MSRPAPPETSVNGRPRPESGVPVDMGSMSNRVRPGPPSNTMRAIGKVLVLVSCQLPEVPVSPASNTIQPEPAANPEPVSAGPQVALWLVPFVKNAVTLIPVI